MHGTIDQKLLAKKEGTSILLSLHRGYFGRDKARCPPRLSRRQNIKMDFHVETWTCNGLPSAIPNATARLALLAQVNGSQCATRPISESVNTWLRVLIDADLFTEPSEQVKLFYRPAAFSKTGDKNECHAVGVGAAAAAVVIATVTAAAAAAAGGWFASSVKLVVLQRQRPTQARRRRRCLPCHRSPSSISSKPFLEAVCRPRMPPATIQRQPINVGGTVCGARAGCAVADKAAADLAANLPCLPCAVNTSARPAALQSTRLAASVSENGSWCARQLHQPESLRFWSALRWGASGKRET
jgi:hypothetical protein